MSAWVGIQVVQFLGAMFDIDVMFMVKAPKIRCTLMHHDLVDIPLLPEAFGGARMTLNQQMAPQY